MGATPAVGTVEDWKFLNETSKDKDIVCTVAPPKWDTDDRKGWIDGNYVVAIKDAVVKYVLNLNSVGANIPDNTGQ